MGTDDRAVVDERLRVRGLTGLRIADCSIMPTVVSGNTHAPAVMIGEKCAYMMLEDMKGWRRRQLSAPITPPSRRSG